MRRLMVLLGALAISGIGCGESTTDVDSGSGFDSGPPTDTGPQPDTGPDPDSGGDPIDSGMPDTGMMVDCAAAIPTMLNTESISGGATFSSPVQVVQPPGSTDLFVVERGGRIRIARGGAILPTPFLNISGMLGGTPSGGAEWGLLSMAFHPDYATNGRFYVGFTPNGGDNTIGEGTRSAGDPDVADATINRIVEVPDFAGNHNGGLVMFGPDGFLYAGMGDGGGACDPRDNGQDLNERLGKILRYDASVAGALTPAAGNPFIGMAGRDASIWEFGLRNPWRFSFDRATGDLWIGDVGQDDIEEISVSVGNPGNQNYGWAMFEGATTMGCPSAACTCSGPLAAGTTHHLPITEYCHSCASAYSGGSVVGGYVYRGSAIPALQGVYVYGDSYESWIRGLRQCGGALTAGPTVINGIGMASGGAGLVSFGQDNAGELYVVFLTGQVERIIAP